jgi:hypothetical protein
MRLWVLFFVFVFTGPVRADWQTPTLTGTGSDPAQGDSEVGSEHRVTVPTNQPWIDTGIELQPGDVLQIAAEASQAGAGKGEPGCDPQGSGSASPDSRLPVNSAAPGALIAKLAQHALPFPVVISKNISINEAGHLYLGANGPASCKGDFAVIVHVGPATATIVKNKLSNAAQIWLAGQVGTSANSSGNGPAGVNGAASGVKTSSQTLRVSSEAIDTKLRDPIDHLPRRVNDQFNNPGDMVNFVIIGSQEQMQKALEAANWHLADTSNSDAITKAIEMTRQNKDYLQMPMSLLYLFGRVQEFGYEQAEPYAVVASRHHFRLWKAPFEYNKQQVWVGAGTHDIGFEKDKRNGSVTHKIDPEVDLERENIAESLQKSGHVQRVQYYLPANPVQDAHNATGGSYQSDGRIAVITLK